MIWGILFKYKDSVYTPCSRIEYKGGIPIIFKTKIACKKYIDKNYGYIKIRKDLRNYPHFWRLPKPTKIDVVEIY